MHSGDLGWHLRSGEDAVDGTLMVWEIHGAPVAAGLLDTVVLRTAFAPGWAASPGLAARMRKQCGELDYAILEPVGTHRDPRRRGYGRHVNLAVMAALARAGASGIRVHSPASDQAAVRAYEACGLRQLDWRTAVTGWGDRRRGCCWGAPGQGR